MEKFDHTYKPRNFHDRPQLLKSSRSRSVFIIAMWSMILATFLAIAGRVVYATPLELGYALEGPPDGVLQDHRGAVATENSICSNIGIDILKEGGNAADSMLASMLCVGVIGMYHSGIGGGGFVLVRAPNGTYESIDFRETAPAAAYEDMYTDDVQKSITGGLASGIPGEIRGLQYVHEKYGSLPWKTLVEPAVNVARNGFPVSQDLVRYMTSAVGDGPDFLTNNPTWAIDFAPNGTRLGLGDTMTRRRYADTLEMIGREGPDSFYNGALAESMIKAVQAENGTMTLDDLKNYQVRILPTAQITYRGYKVHSTSAPSSGGVVLSTLKILEGYRDMFLPESINISTHRLTEAMRFGYGQRTSLGDPDFVEGLDTFQDEMINETTASIIRGRISDLHTLNVSAYNPDGVESVQTHGTSHIVTADRSGLALSITSTINLLFGSQIMTDTGIIMNDEMNDFSVPGVPNQFGYAPQASNYVRAGKRPLSSISPVIVEHPNSTLYYVVGAAGGSRIISANIQNLLNVLDRNMTVAEALAEPRLHDQLIPNQTGFELQFDNSTVAFMRGRGHNVTSMSFQSSAQGLTRSPNGTFLAAGEPRQADSRGITI